MGKILKSFPVLLLLLVACSAQKPDPSHEPSETIIDWVDFIKIDDRQYTALYTIAIADEKYIGSEAGDIQFHVDKHITDPEYSVKNGDAAFWEKGTVVYHVKDKPDLLAIKDPNKVNDYRIYQADEVEESWQFEHVRRDDVKKIEIQKGDEKPETLKTMSGQAEIDRFIDLLESGKNYPEQAAASEEPEMYHIVFYSEQPVASYYPLLYDGEKWYWHPFEEEVLPDDIGEFILDE